MNIKKTLKYFLIALAVFVALFLITDDILMPAYVQKGKTTKVPDVIGMNLDEAKKTLLASGLEAKEFETRPDKQYPVGTVSGQSPLPNAEVKFGRGIYLTVSGGELLVAVPNLRGKSLREASFSLEKFGLKLGTIEYQPSEELFENTIISQDVAPAARAKAGTVVNVVVSLGKSSDRQAVPNIAMKTLSEAEKMIVQAGFTVGNIVNQPSLDILPNTVIDQYPRAGEFARIGQPIDLFVAQKAERKATSEN